MDMPHWMLSAIIVCALVLEEWRMRARSAGNFLNALGFSHAEKSTSVSYATCFGSKEGPRATLYRS